MTRQCFLRSVWKRPSFGWGSSGMPISVTAEFLRKGAEIESWLSVVKEMQGKGSA